MAHPLCINVNIDRVVTELEKLASLSDCPDPAPAVTRIVFTETDRHARAFLSSLYESAGLTVRVDSVGNTFARWIGEQPHLSAIGTGSHTDAIPFSGMYDGTVGVLGGLEAIRSLIASGFQPKRSIELLMFTSEEPTRFGVGCTGSRVMTGGIDEADLDDLVDADGENYNTVRKAAGFQGSVDESVLPAGYYHAWIELHIEQGPELENRGLPIGIVTAIAAPATLVIDVTGVGGHAGAVLMPTRRDALCAASEMISAVERIARASPSADLVATVGELSVHPGAVNSIPSHVRFTIDLRDIDQSNRDDVKQNIENVLSEIGESRQVTLECRTTNQDPPAIASQSVMDAAERACQDAGLDYQKMISRAYHDSLFMAQVAPMSMLFIPCRNGISHRPDEYSSPEQMAAGIEVLARTLAELSWE